MAQFSTSGSNVPILLINGSASLMTQTGDGSGAVEGPSAANSMVNALKLAAAFARLTQPATDEEGLNYGKLLLQNSRGFWNGTDLALTIGEYKIIELLRSRPGQYFPYRAIYDRLRHEGFRPGACGRTGYSGLNVRSSLSSASCNEVPGLGGQVPRDRMLEVPSASPLAQAD